ncbi:MAG: hypothetical protein GVY13_15075 [Alphaproteobacteria bacterium]|jgi:predicted lipoprotein|nr:hypothetical protein [Alphaproteobacteria bacterium]
MTDASVTDRVTQCHRRRGALLAAAICASLALGTAHARSADGYAARVAERLVADHQAVVETAGMLVDAVAGFCGGDGAREDAQAAYHATADAYMRVQWAAVGPAVPFDRGYRLNFWPDDSNAISRQLGRVASERPADLLDPDGIAAASVALQGLPALERLLFGQPAAAPGNYGCGLAEAITVNIVTIAEDLVEGWADPARQPGLSTDQAAVQTLLSASLTHLELIGDRKIARVVGPTAEDARPRRSEAWRSGRSLRNIAINLAALEAVWLDDGPDDLPALLQAADAASTAESLAAAMAKARGLAESLRDRTMEEASETAHAELLALSNDLYGVARILVHDVFPALGLTVGFNSVDGD